jgi:hypothetical protein
MKKLLLFTTLSFLLLTNSFSQTYDKIGKENNGYRIVLKSGKYGYIDSKDKLVAPTKYDKAYAFSKHKVAAVELNKKEGYINNVGEVIIPINNKWVGGVASDGGIIVQKNTLYDLYNYRGEQLTKVGYDKIMKPTPEGLRRVILDKKHGAINGAGKVIIPIIYDYLHKPQKNGIIYAEKNGWSGCFNSAGKQITKIKYKTLYAYSKDNKAQFKTGGITGVIDINGKESGIEYPADKTYEEENGFSRFRKKGLYGVIDANKKEVLSPIYNYTGSFNTDFKLVIVRNGPYLGVVNKSNKIIIPIEYDKINGPDENGVFKVEKNYKLGEIDNTGKVIKVLTLPPTLSKLTKYKSGEKWGYKNTSGIIVIKPQYDNVSDFYKVSGYDKFYARAIKNGKWGLINKKNETVLEFHYTKIWDFKNDIAIVKKDGRYGYYKAYKGFLTKIKFADAFDFNKEGYLAKVTMKKKGSTTYGYINKKGQEVIPPIYNKVRECKNGNILATFSYSSNIVRYNATNPNTKFAIYNSKGEQDVNLILDDLTYGSNDGNKSYGKYWFKINGKAGEISQTSINQKKISKIAKVNNSDYGLDKFTTYDKNYIYIYNNTTEVKRVHFNDTEFANFRAETGVKYRELNFGELLIIDCKKWKEVYVSKGSLSQSKKVVSKGYKSNCGKVIAIGNYLPDYVSKVETTTYINK